MRLYVINESRHIIGITYSDWLYASNIPYIDWIGYKIITKFISLDNFISFFADKSMLKWDIPSIPEILTNDEFIALMRKRDIKSIAVYIK